MFDLPEDTVQSIARLLCFNDLVCSSLNLHTCDLLGRRIDNGLVAKQRHLALTCRHFLPLLGATEKLWLSGEADALSSKIYSLNRFLTTASSCSSSLSIILSGELSPVLPVLQYGCATLPVVSTYHT
jgi:hypothetical protein